MLENTWTIEVFFDGACPLCRREMDAIRRLDRRRRIRFTDIAATGFDPEVYGKTMDALMDRIHGRLPGGGWVEGVEVFRRIYTALGLGWVVWPTRLPGILHLLNWLYARFAANRLRLTGRCSKGACAL